MEKIRAFIAVELSDEIKRILTRLQDTLRAGAKAPVRWTNPEGTHLTLQFLGDIDTGIIDRINAVMIEAACGIHPFRLELGNTGVFPNPQRVRVVWVGLAGDLEILQKLQKRTESGMAPLGFKPEARAFTPHLTLGRVRDDAAPDDRRRLGELVAGMKVNGPASFQVKAVHLFRSQLRPQGDVYSKVISVVLK